MVPPNFDEIAAALAHRYGQAGQQAAARLKQWVSDEVPFANSEIITQHLSEEHLELLFEAFWQVLPFGTGGRRGRVGYGANRINETTVALAIQGHCNFLKKGGSPGSERAVVIANDVRTFRDVNRVYSFLPPDHPLIGLSSRRLAKLACEIYCANGFIAYLEDPDNDEAILTTPELSFFVRELKAAAGLVVSASHNPPDDNGIKVYDAAGGQPVAPQDQLLLDEMEAASTVRSVPFSQALAEQRIRPIPEAAKERYFRMYLELYGDFEPADAKKPVTFTPLCGCGGRTAGALLRRLGFNVLTPPAEGPDGSFNAIPLRCPNPEVPQSTEPAREFAARSGSDLVISTDPDADRIGAEVLRDGEWVHLDGNQLAAILLYAIMLDPEGPRRQGLVVETLVTTRLLGAIVKQAGESQIVDDLLVGFKYVADLLKQLDESGRYRNITAQASDLVLAAEESHGAMMHPQVRDKDAAPAAAFLTGLQQRLRGRGQTLVDYYAAMLERLGGYDNVNRSIVMSGAAGEERKRQLMDSLRAEAPKALAGHPVVQHWDYLDEARFGKIKSESERLPRNVLLFRTDRFDVTVRPSGTEPKLKFYCALVADKDEPPSSGANLLEELRDKANEVASTLYNELLMRVGLRLSEASLLLPDIVELNLKLHFDEAVLPALKAHLSASPPPPVDDLLSWLREQTADLFPGADPLPALTRPIAKYCTGADVPHNDATRALLKWARPGGSADQ